jgi:hypothetical protein
LVIVNSNQRHVPSTWRTRKSTGDDDSRQILGVMDLVLWRPEDVGRVDADELPHRRADIGRPAFGVADDEEVVGVLDQRAIPPLALADAAGDDGQIPGRASTFAHPLFRWQVPQH